MEQRQIIYAIKKIHAAYFVKRAHAALEAYKEIFERATKEEKDIAVSFFEKNARSVLRSKKRSI